MNKNIFKNNEAEYIKITKMVLKGMTISKIADNLNYSESTVSNRLNDLFQKYNAKNRFEFIYNFFSKIIQKYKVKLEFTSNENEDLKKNLSEIKKIIINSEKNSISLSDLSYKPIEEIEF